MLKAKCVQRPGGVKCTAVQGTRMSACLKSPIIPLFFFSFTFIAQTLSLFILSILFWMLKRTSVVFCFCIIALTFHLSLGHCGYLRLEKNHVSGSVQKKSTEMNISLHYKDTRAAQETLGRTSAERSSFTVHLAKNMVLDDAYVSTCHRSSHPEGGPVVPSL